LWEYFSIRDSTIRVNPMIRQATPSPTKKTIPIMAIVPMIFLLLL